MSDIFISYASKDRDRAEIIAKALSNYGWTVWWDRTIPAGQTFCTVIEKALAEAKCIMVLWSGHSVSSNWVQEEAEEGHKKEILIPVLIEKVRPPMGFRNFQAADLTDWNGVEKTPSFNKLIADITNVIGPPLNLTKEREYKPQKEVENKVEKQEESKEKAEKTFRLPVSKKGSRRHFIWGICTIVLVLVGVIVLHFFKILPNFRNNPNSEEKKNLKLPNFIGKPYSEAKNTLKSYGIDFETIPKDLHDLTDSNVIIIKQKPESGTVVIPKSDRVNLEIGIKMPNFKNKPFSEAKNTLKSYGIDFETIPITYSALEDNKLENDMIIIGQIPENGAEIPMDKMVTLEIGRKKIFAIVDVQVYNGHPGKMTTLYNDYTGLSDNICTDSYIHEKMGKRLTGYDVNTGIGGATVTIWVKYEELPITSIKPVLVDIEVKHWPGWKVTYPRGGGWKPASGNDGKLTSGTKGGCWRNGLCVKYMPLKDANTIITNVGLAINRDCPSECNYGDKPIITNLEKSGIDIHKACGDKRTVFVCANHVSPEEIANTVQE